MSRSYSANQYEQDFQAHRLGNWEVPARQVLSAFQKEDRPTARTGKTQFIVKENGYLLDGRKVPGSAFIDSLPDRCRSPSRWPKDTYTHGAAPCATMGYKGIATNYLNTSTVTIPSVEIPGCKEKIFRNKRMSGI